MKPCAEGAEIKLKQLYIAAVFLLLVFAAVTCLIIFIPEITLLDIEIIKKVQQMLSGFNPAIPAAAGGIVFYIMLFLPLAAGAAVLYAEKQPAQAVLYFSSPFSAYLINSIIKVIVNRPRPPIELQIEEHMTSSSYISRHTFLTGVLWGILICIIFKYCKNRPLKYFLISAAFLWIIFEGFSRVWLGVHYPGDVIGAFAASGLFIILYWIIPLKTCRIFCSKPDKIIKLSS